MSSRKDLTAQERARLSPGQIAHGQPRPAGVAQSKAVARPVVAPGQQNVRRPVAPPPYRPQPVPKVLQTKPAIAGRATAQPSPNRAAPSAPPSRRPQPVPPNANARGTAAGVNAPRPFGASQRGGPTQGRAVASVPARVKPPALGGGGSGVRAGMKHGPASVQLKPGTPRPCCPRHSSVVQLNDPKYVKPLDYGTRTAPKGSSEYQYAASQILPDTQTTYATAKLNGYYLAKYFSSGDHAEQSIVDHVKELCDSNDGVLLPIGQKNKLSIHLNKSPCTSTPRGGKPKTRTDGAAGCTERLIDLATNGYKGHTFYIRLKIQNLYQPQIKGAKAASKLALVALEANGISVIGYNREYKLEKARDEEESHRSEPLSPSHVASMDFEYSDTQKGQLDKQWNAVSAAVGKGGVYKWQDNS